MGLSKRQQALIRIGEAYVNGEEPEPGDVEYCRKTTRGTPIKGMDYEHFHKRLNSAFDYFYAMAQGMNATETHKEAEKNLGLQIGKKSLESYCNYLRNGDPPTDPRAQWHLEHTRAALEQVERAAGINPQKRQKLNKDYNYPLHAPGVKPERIHFPK